MKTNDLHEYMVDATRQMASDYLKIEKLAAEDTGTAGDQGEENWAALLQNWLPRAFHVVTKGKILSHCGETGPQVDVLILHPEYPEGLLDKKLYLAGGVAAAFECKVTLKARDIRKTIQNGVKIRKLASQRYGSPFKELHSPIIYGLLAHSHVWKGPRSKPVENIERHLIEQDQVFVKCPREMLDVVCVADLVTWLPVKISYFGPRQVAAWSPDSSSTYGPEGAVIAAYVGASDETPNQSSQFTPIGRMIAALMRRLAWETPTLRPLAQYFKLSNIEGMAAGRGTRLWEASVYSERIREKVVSKPFPLSSQPWDEWANTFY